MSLSDDLHAQRAEQRRAIRRAERSVARQHVWIFVGLAAVAAIVGPAHPTGHVVIDAVYRAAFAGLIAAATARSHRAPTLVFAALGLAFSRGWWIAPAAVTTAGAFAMTFQPRRFRRVGAAIGAVGAQVVLHLHHVGFHGSTALVAAVAVVPVFVSAYGSVGPRVRTIIRRAALAALALAIVCSIPVAVAALLSRTQLSAGVQETRTAFDAASDANQASTITALNAAHGDFASAHRKASNALTALAGLVPVVSQHRHALSSTTSLAVKVTSAASTTARQADYGQLRYQGGRLDVARLAAMETPLVKLRDTLTAARRTAGNLSNPWLVAPVDHRLGDLTRELDRALPDARLAAQAAAQAPDLLGGNGVRHYLVAFMTPAEQRGLDGFIGAWGEITADNGSLRLTRSGNAQDWLDAAPKGARTLIGPQEYIDRYGAFGVANSPADAFYSPDFPRDAQVLAGLYPQSGGEPVDGVLALDPQALAALVSITGPIQVQGRSQPLTSANLADFLLSGQYVEFPQTPTPGRGGTTTNTNAARKDFLQEVLRTTFDRLTSGTLPGPRALGKTLSPQVHQGRLLFWSSHAADESLVRSAGLDGAMPVRAGADYLSVTTQNEAQNKIDVYLGRAVSYDVQTDPASGATSATATVTLHNFAPATGLPAYVIGNAFKLPSGTNASYVSVNSALSLESATVDGASVAASSAREAGTNAFGVSVKIPPGATVTVVFSLRGALAVGTPYRLVLDPQPMVHAEVVTVSAKTSPDWTISGASTRRFTLTAPQTLTINTRRK